MFDSGIKIGWQASFIIGGKKTKGQDWDFSNSLLLQTKLK